MEMRRYYDEKSKSVIDLEKESCSLENWHGDRNNKLCCRHPKGFYIFLTPGEIASSDEYQESDPYTVIENLNSEFHRRRKTCTGRMIRESNSGVKSKLLDIGCGQGHFTNMIKSEFADYEVHGLDYSISAIEYAHSNFKDIDFIVANAYYPPFEDGFFDIVVCNNIWEHVPDPLNLLKSISRVLKPEGLLIISTPSRYKFTNLVKACLGKKISLNSELHVTEYTVGQVKEQLKYGGYEVTGVLSPMIKESRLVFTLAKRVVSLFLRITGSHHSLERTVFYSAVKR